jgi:cell volume regulation protein A
MQITSELLLSLPGQASGTPLSAVPLELQVLFIGAVYLGSLIMTRFSVKLGVPGILGVLVLGLLINIKVLNVTHQDVASLQVFALALLLFYAGLKTDIQAIRGFLSYGLLLAMGGVVVSTLVLGLGLVWLSSDTAALIDPGFVRHMPIGVAMLVAACLGATDTGPTLSVLRQVGKLLPERLRLLLEFESAVNDPSALITYKIVLYLFVASSASETATQMAGSILGSLVHQLGSGVLLGIGFGYLARLIINRFVIDQEQLLIVAMSVAFMDYGFTAWVGGSGLVAVYATGVLMTNFKYRNPEVNHNALQDVLVPFNSMTEISIFLLCGLLVNPADLLPSLPAGVGAAVVLMLVARPLSVVCFQPFSPFSWRDTALIGWCGLRGAVPLALSFEVVQVIPTLRGVPEAMGDTLAHNAQSIVFIVVIINLLVQARTLPPLCRWLNGQAKPTALSSG